MSLDALAERLRTLDNEINSVKEILKKLNEDYAKNERELMAKLTEQNLKSFKCDHGSFSVVTRFSVKLPDSPENWENFWKYLHETGQEESLKTVNSQKLNSWYKEQLELAKERGDIDWLPPGLKEPSASEYISMRKS